MIGNNMGMHHECLVSNQIGCPLGLANAICAKDIPLP